MSEPDPKHTTIILDIPMSIPSTSHLFTDENSAMAYALFVESLGTAARGGDPDWEQWAALGFESRGEWRERAYRVRRLASWMFVLHGRGT